MFEFWRRRQRAKKREETFPAAWAAILEKNVAFYRKLSPEDRAELEWLVLVFLDEKTFEGCGGLELTDEIRVTIAAQACLLLLHREHDLYPELDVILVYPAAFRARTHKNVAAHATIEETSDRLGEAGRGVVVLSWADALAGGQRPGDGKNVVLHEFAHQIDLEDGAMDGAPDLESGDRYSSWAKVLSSEYNELLERLAEGRSSDIDAYGATNPQEFFAVLTEAFFEKPHALKKRHPALYGELAAFYQQDPAGDT